jgi:hypothetical protein
VRCRFWERRGRQGGGSASGRWRRRCLVGLLEDEDGRSTDRVGPPGSDRGRAGGYWASVEVVGREEGGRLGGGGP